MRRLVAPLLLLATATAHKSLRIQRKTLITIAAAKVASIPATAVVAIPPLDLILKDESGNANQQSNQQPQVLYTPPAIKGLSSPQAIALAKHLKRENVKMYGAYWCSHCFSQKQLFGAGGARIIDYVECAQDGYNSQRELCRAKNIKGYPTWEIGGKLYPGERSLEALEELSGFTKS